MPTLVANLFDNISQFVIPNYQRGYSWSKRHWGEFLTDIRGHPLNQRQYLGVLTLQPCEIQNVQEVVDGQQRLTTLLILASVLRRQVAVQNPDKIEIVQQLRNLVEDPQGNFRLRYAQDTTCYQGDTNVLRQLLTEANPDPQIINHTSSYTARLLAAYTYFFQAIATLPNGKALEIANTVLNSIEFQEHTIQRWQALVVFEQLNNRGKPLSIMEKLKNRLLYLSARLGEQETVPEQINAVWSEVYRILGQMRPATNWGKDEDDEDFDTDFLRDHWIMRWGRKRDKADSFRICLLENEFTVRRLPGVDSFHFEIHQIHQPRKVLLRLDFIKSDTRQSKRNQYLITNFFNELAEYVKGLNGDDTKQKLDNADEDKLKVYLVKGLNLTIDHDNLLQQGDLELQPECVPGYNAQNADSPILRREFLERHLNKGDEMRNVESLNKERISSQEIIQYCRELSWSIKCWFAIRDKKGFETLFTDDFQNEHLYDYQGLREWLARLRLLDRKDTTPLVLAALLALLQRPTPGAFGQTIKLLKRLERLAFLNSIAGLGVSRDDIHVFGNKLYRHMMNPRDGASLPELCDKVDLALGTPKTVFNSFKAEIEKRAEKGGFYKLPNGLLRYLLWELECMPGHRYGPPPPNLADVHGNAVYDGEARLNAVDELQIEHVLPQSVARPERRDNWPEFAGHAVSRMVGSLGNLVLVTGAFNLDCSNNPYAPAEAALPPRAPQHLQEDFKKDLYAAANGCTGAQKIAELHKRWAPDDILLRGIEILNFIERRWEVYLGSDHDKSELLGLGDIVQGLPTTKENLSINAMAMRCYGRRVDLFINQRTLDDQLSNHLGKINGCENVLLLAQKAANDPWLVLGNLDNSGKKERCLLFHDILIALLKSDQIAIDGMFPRSLIGTVMGRIRQLDAKSINIIEKIWGSEKILIDEIPKTLNIHCDDVDKAKIQFKDDIEKACQAFVPGWTETANRNERYQTTRNAIQMLIGLPQPWSLIVKNALQDL
jgi:hypothetical protein